MARGGEFLGSVQDQLDAEAELVAAELEAFVVPAPIARAPLISLKGAPSSMEQLAKQWQRKP